MEHNDSQLLQILMQRLNQPDGETLRRILKRVLTLEEKHLLWLTAFLRGIEAK